MNALSPKNSAEGEGIIGPHAGIKELDLECAVGDMPWLADHLMHLLLTHHALALFIHVAAIADALEMVSPHKRDEGCERRVGDWFGHADRMRLLLAFDRESVRHVVSRSLRWSRSVGRQVKEVALDHQSVKLTLLLQRELRAVHDQRRAYQTGKAAFLL